MSNQVNIFNDKDFDLENFPNLAPAILDQALKGSAKKNYIVKNAEVAVVFIDEAQSLLLNRTYRKKDYIADVLSFANQDKFSVKSKDINDLGDVYVCFPKAQQQAFEYQHSLNRELSFLFLHGLLHNLGYDHETQAEEDIMFALQDQVLTKLKILRN
ncbi:MAG: rRNA maturation RNase YbeY [Spiroplasma sp.]|nr:rRNA maturation RNase YbeY [Spiroplasma sp.]